jgi:protein tyrosine phosphatase (PTP) superfamily phosphohydrolase (DUF442 family)
MKFTARIACLWLIAFAIILALLCPACAPRAPKVALDPQPAAALAVASTAAPAERPAEWAKAIEKPGLPNLHKVSGDLYRGAQPDKEGYAQLKALGIKTVLNLRAFHSDRAEVRAAGMGYESISMKAWHPEDEDVVKFLKIATDKSRTPVFVHCQYGADRTGTMCAIYRIAVCGWSKEEAIREMTEGGFGFHKAWQNLVRYIEGLDVEKLKRQAGLNVSSLKARQHGRMLANRPRRSWAKE